MTENKISIKFAKGGVGSGHRGHAGRPGKRGGSLPGGGEGGISNMSQNELSGLITESMSDDRATKFIGDDGDRVILETTMTFDSEETAKAIYNEEGKGKYHLPALIDTLDEEASTSVYNYDSKQDIFADHMTQEGNKIILEWGLFYTSKD